MKRPNTLLTAARAQRAARQYFGDPSTMVRETVTETGSSFLFNCGARVAIIKQEERGIVMFTEDGETDSFILPPIGPINFKKPL